VADQARIARTSRIGTRLPVILTGAALALAGYLFVRAIMVWAAPSSVLSAPSAPTATTPKQADVADRSILSRFDPFWPETEIVQSAVENAPETRLNLTLFAVRVTGEEAGSATIGMPDQVLGTGATAQRVYQIGEEIAPGVVLTAIYPDRVLLSREGVSEALMFPTEGEAGAPRTVSSSPPGATPGATPRTTAAAPTASARSPNAFPPSEGVSDFRGLLSRTQLSVVRRDGAPSGFAFGKDADPGVLRHYGLRPDDFVVQINRTPVFVPGPNGRMGPQESLFQSMQDAREVELGVMRNGQLIHITVAFDKAPQ